ncbi:MAG: TolC family protein [bacterium]|nr:TolC family protein [bacterium]
MLRQLSSTLVLVLVGMLAGCAGMHPWDEARRTPASPTTPFLARGPAAAVPSRPVRPSLRDTQDGPLTLAQCVRIALERNPRTRSSWLSSLSAAATVGEKQAAFFPSVDLTSEARRADPALLDREAQRGPGNAFDAGIGFGYLLFDGGARSSRVRGAEADLLAANFHHNATLQDVALSVEEAYYESLADRSSMKVAEEAVKQAQSHVELAEARHAAGVVARSDVLKGETEKAAADLELVRARSAVQIARGRLSSAMGLSVSESFEIADLPKQTNEQNLSDIYGFLNEAARNRPELQSALAQVEGKRAEVKAAQARYWPVLTSNASYGWQDRELEDDREAWAVAVGMSLPIFSGFERAYQVRRAKYDLDKTISDHAELLRGVELEVWTAYSRVVEADQAIDAAGKLVASAEESARAAEAEYRTGAGSIIELIDAQTARTAANTRRVQADLDWHVARARLRRAIGQMAAEPMNAVTERGGGR